MPEQCYRRAAAFINSTWLGLRLDFHLVPSRPMMPPSLTNDRVPGRLDFKREHPHHLWLATELVRRFNHRCCASIAELETTERGLTREGLVRNGSRHTKDDATVDDPGQRILGWSTGAKIEALRQQVELAEQLATQEGRTVREAQQQADASRKRHDAARELLTIEDYSAIDVQRWRRGSYQTPSGARIAERIGIRSRCACCAVSLKKWNRKFKGFLTNGRYVIRRKAAGSFDCRNAVSGFRFGSGSSLPSLTMITKLQKRISMKFRGCPFCS